MGAPAYKHVVAIVFMLSCLVGCNYCIESFPTINSNPLWLRWLREQRSNNNNRIVAPPPAPLALAAPVSLEYQATPTALDGEGKEAGLATPTNNINQAVAAAPFSKSVARQERGERRFEDQKFPGFAIFNDFGTATGGTISPFGVFNNNNQAAADQVGSTTFKPEVTTLNFPSQQPQLSNGVTFANLLKRARLRTSEDTTITTPLSYTEEDETTTLPSFTTTITATSSIPTTTLSTTSTSTTTPTTSTSTTTRRPLTTLNELYSSRASSRYKPRTVTSLNPIVAQRLISSSRIPESRFIISKRRQSLGRARRKTTTQATTTATTTTTTTTTSTTVVRQSEKKNNNT